MVETAYFVFLKMVFSSLKSKDAAFDSPRGMRTECQTAGAVFNSSKLLGVLIKEIPLAVFSRAMRLLPQRENCGLEQLLHPVK